MATAPMPMVPLGEGQGPVEDEIDAICEVARVLGPLDHPARVRVIEWALAAMVDPAASIQYPLVNQPETREDRIARVREILRSGLVKAGWTGDELDAAMAAFDDDSTGRWLFTCAACGATTRSAAYEGDDGFRCAACEGTTGTILRVGRRSITERLEEGP